MVAIRKCRVELTHGLQHQFCGGHRGLVVESVGISQRTLQQPPSILSTGPPEAGINGVEFINRVVNSSFAK